MGGLYSSIFDAITNLIYTDGNKIEELTREQVKAEIKTELATWNKRHAGEGVEA